MHTESQPAFDFIATAASRETSEEVMRAIARLAQDGADAVRIWGAPTERELLAIWETATHNGMHEASEYIWGADGTQWARAMGLPPLALTEHGAYEFDAGGIGIRYPLVSSCGRFPCTPEAYGFAVVTTGGGFTAWARDFALHGERVQMLITHPMHEGHEVAPGEDVRIGVHYVAADGSASFVSWIQPEGMDLETGTLLPPNDFIRDGELPAARCPVNGSPEFTAAVPRIAHAFAVALRSQLFPEQLALVVKRNHAETDPLVCHSHDFCDSNMVMLEAFAIVGFETVCGISCKSPDANARMLNSSTLWNAAWEMAQEHDFAPIV